MRALCLVLLLISGSVALAQNQAKSPVDVHPGDTVQVTANGLITNDTITLNFKWTDGQPNPPSGCSEIQPITVAGASAANFSFGVPPDACVGQYQLTATKPQPASAAGTTNAGEAKPINVNITSPEFIQVKQKPPDVTGISPKAIFRDEQPPKGAPPGYVGTLVFLGPSSLKADADYTIRFKDYALSKCGKENNEPPQNGENCFEQAKAGTGGSQDGQIKFYLRGNDFLKKFSGEQQVSLVQNGSESAAKTFIVADASVTAPRNYAIGVTAALVVLIYFLIRAGGRALQGQSSKGSFFLTALFLDEPTQTYSLSKCQFYAWTLAAILGYIFLAVARSVIQGSAAFPDIPSGLPAILLFSAGTSVIATGVSNVKGDKGAGEIHPTLADFITSGGVVAPERLQFVVWTVVGVFTFLTIVFKSDPVTVSDLPKIPDGFLQLMGISSAGYLGGKLARKPGPKIAVLSVGHVTRVGETVPQEYKPEDNNPVQQPVLSLNLKGDGLDPHASVKIDDQPLRGDLFWVTGTPDPQQSGFCTELNVSLKDAAAYLEGPHTLTLVNSDSQAAVANFPIDIMSIESVEPANLPHGTAQVDVTVTGKNFVTDTKAEWSAPLPTPAPVPAPAPVNVTVSFQSATKLKVSLTPGAQTGSGTLTLKSPVGLRASGKVTVT